MVAEITNVAGPLILRVWLGKEKLGERELRSDELNVPAISEAVSEITA